MCGEGIAKEKVALMRALERARLEGARSVRELHETLLFIRSRPDDAAVLATSERLLRAFARRRDLRRHREALADSGIAGTDIHYAFFQATASRLARAHGKRLAIDWESFEKQDLLEERLALAAAHGETPAIDEGALNLRDWIRRMKPREESEAAFVVGAFDRLAVSDPVREQLFDELELPLVLRAGPGTPSRTTGRLDGLPAAFATAPPRPGRPDLREDVRRGPLAVRDATPAEARRLIALARDAMVTRSRDLDAFAYADPRDVRLVDCGGGLWFAVMGVIPVRRLMLESVSAWLTLLNGVPAGYVLVSALFGSSEIAYNVFDAWRGAEAAWTYGRVLAVARALFGSDTFTIYPYQLGGDGNDEGLESGAWWFYRKLGFLPRDAGVLRLMRAEERRIARRPAHRSSLATLRKLAAENVYFHLGPRRDDVIGIYPLEKAGLAVADILAARDRDEAACAAEAARLLGARGWRRWPAGERLWFRRWSPLVLALPGVARWSRADRAALVRVIRAKGGAREAEFVALCDGHRRLRDAFRRLARE